MKSHIIWMVRGKETILGPIADKNEIFISMLCDDIKVMSISNCIGVIQQFPPKDWATRGGRFDGDEIEKYHIEKDLLYYKMTYDSTDTR